MKTKTPNNESGSALLLTLGILSLALIVAMAFAFSTRTNRQIAKVNADQIKARLLAKSALNRVIAAMKMETDIYLPESSNLFDGVPKKNELPKFFASSGSDATYDWSNDSSVLPVLAMFGTDDSDEKEDLPKVYFQRIEVKENEETEESETIGRVAFLVLEEANKLDVNQMLSLSGKIPFVLAGENRLASFNESCSNADFFYDILGDGTNDGLPITPEDSEFEYDKQTLRLGLQMQELRVKKSYYHALPMGYTNDTFRTKAKWFSYTHLWRKLWSSNSEDALRYTFFSGEDIEAFWDGSTERQRFDITGYEWRADGVSSGWKCPPEDQSDQSDQSARAAAYARWLVEELTASSERPAFWVDDKTPAPHPVVEEEEEEIEHSFKTVISPEGEEANGFGIPYLHSLEVVKPNHGKQIAANMVDFCDADSSATTDATWDGTPPTYCGNEKVSYINEIHLSFVLQEEETNSDPPTTIYQLKLTPSLEMVNIFNEDFPKREVRIRISGQVKFGAAEAVEWSYDSEYTMDKQVELSYATHDLGEQEVAETRTLPPAEVTGELLVIIGSSNQIYDVAYCKISPKVTLVKVGDSKVISLEVSDPRCNHRSDCWKVGDTGSLGSDNSNFTANFSQAGTGEGQSTQDWESGVSFTTDSASTFSTAFIPNRPFRNFWELGAIHRGEPFRTLDIAGQDAGILDQVKIGSLKRTHGKFNANSRNPLAWQELLRGINPQDGYDSITYFDPEEEFITTTPSGVRSHSRAAIAVTLAGYGFNDREREALIGRTANLLTTRMDKYSVLVIGQALKKLDGVTESNWDAIKKSVVNPIEYEDGYYSILATQRILAHIVRDAWRNEYKIVQLQLLED